MRFVLPLLSLLIFVAVGCVDHTASSLVGSMRLTMDGAPTSVPFSVDGPPGKLRAQIAKDHHTRSIAVNAATIYITQGSDTYYAVSGTVTASALPVTKGSIHIDVDVIVKDFSKSTTAPLKGTIDATYIGATRSGTTNACPQIPDVPNGLIF